MRLLGLPHSRGCLLTATDPTVLDFRFRMFVFLFQIAETIDVAHLMSASSKWKKTVLKIYSDKKKRLNNTFAEIELLLAVFIKHCVALDESGLLL